MDQERLNKMDKYDKYHLLCGHLGEYAAPFFTMMDEERKRKEPCKAILNYCENRIFALRALQNDLTADDEEIIDRILLDKTMFKTL